MEYEIGACRPEELPALGELANRVFRAGRDGDMLREYPLLFDPANADNLMVARAGSQLVSHVGVCLRDATLLGASIRVAGIGAVATDPEHRGHQLASRLMAQARRTAVEQGASLMLISGTRGLYHRLGYVQVGAFDSYRIPAGPAAGDYRVERLGLAAIPELARLHQTEPVRYVRPQKDWQKLLAAGMLMNQPADLLGIRLGERLVAYAAVQRPAPSGGQVPQVVRVREYAGSRAALAAVLPSLGGRYDVPEVDLVAWPADAAWSAEALRCGWHSEETPFGGTLGIIDPARFLEAVRPILAERAGDEVRLEPSGEGAILRAGGREVRLESMGQLTALVFGGSTDEARALPDLPAAATPARNGIFPLPLLWYGYNYV